MIALTVFVVWRVFGDMLPEYMRMLSEGDEEAIESYIAREAAWKGVAAVVLLSALQVLSIVFPGFAIQIASGIIYGWLRALIMCYGGFLLGNVIVFTVARRMGSEIHGFAPKRKESVTASRLRAKMRTTRPGFIVALLNLIPIIPNGIIPYMAAGSSITFSEFLSSIAMSSWVQILFNCLAGNFLKNGQYFFMVLAIGVQVLLVVIVARNQQRIISLLPGGNDMYDEDEIDVPYEEADDPGTAGEISKSSDLEGSKNEKAETAQ